MPFVNEAQRRACYAQRDRDLRRGEKVKWDCKSYGRKGLCISTTKNNKKCKRKAEKGFKKCWQHI